MIGDSFATWEPRHLPEVKLLPPTKTGRSRCYLFDDYIPERWFPGS